MIDGCTSMAFLQYSNSEIYLDRGIIIIITYLQEQRYIVLYILMFKNLSFSPDYTDETEYKLPIRLCCEVELTHLMAEDELDNTVYKIYAPYSDLTEFSKTDFFFPGIME